MTAAEVAEGMLWVEMRKARELKPTPRVEIVATDEKGQVSVALKGDKNVIWCAKMKAALGGVEGAVAQFELSRECSASRA